jgi:hypothetical protein
LDDGCTESRSKYESLYLVASFYIDRTEFLTNYESVNLVASKLYSKQCPFDLDGADYP